MASPYLVNESTYENLLPEELAQNILINPVDAYRSYTYRLTMSMLPYTFYQTGEVDLNFDQASRIIIAQTGVTKFVVDQLQIFSVVHHSPPANLSGNINSNYKLNFELTEPFGMSLIDLLNRTAYELNKEAGIPFPGSGPPLQTMPYLMEIELLGYGDEENAKGGEPDFGEVFYHTAIPFRIVDFDIDPQTSGTTYSMSAVTISEINKSADRSVRNVAKDITIESQNGTVAELLESYSKQMQDQQKALPDESTTGDDFAVETGTYALAEEGMPSAPEIFKDGLPIDPEYYTADISLKKIKDFKNKTKEGVETDDKAGTEDTADPNALKGKAIRIKIPTGTPASEVMMQLASLNSDFCDLAHRYDIGKEAATKNDKEQLKKDQTFQVIPTIYKTYDWPDKKFTKTGKMALDHTYYLTGKLDSVNVLGPEEVAVEVDGEKEKTAVRKAAQNRDITKMYAYYYTGINDQVYEVDLKIANGIRYMMPGYGGKQANYRQSAAGAADKGHVEDAHKGFSGAKATVESIIIEKFAAIGNDIKDVVTKLAKLPIELTADLASLATGLNPVGAGSKATLNIRQLNARLPSSPLNILQKTNTIGSLTSSLDTLSSNIQNLRQEIEGEISSIVDSQIAEIMSKAFVPFDILDSGLNKLASGVNGFIDTIDAELGDLGLDQFGINLPGLLDNARDKVDEIIDGAKSSTTPPGFNSGTDFGSVTSTSKNYDSLYMEEFEFDEKEYGSQIMEIGRPFGEYDSQEFLTHTNVVVPPSKFINRSMFSTMLSNSSLGAPYMVRTAIDIKGDPYWMGKSPIGEDRKFVYISGKEYLGDRDNDVEEVRKQSKEQNVAPYGIGEVSFFFAYLFPREYDTWHDEGSRHTGEMKDLSMDQSFSGQFTPYRVVHMFAGGTFRQTLEAYRITFKGQYPMDFKEMQDKLKADAAKKAEIADQLSQTIPAALGLTSNEVDPLDINSLDRSNISFNYNLSNNVDDGQIRLGDQDGRFTLDLSRLNTGDGTGSGGGGYV